MDEGINTPPLSTQSLRERQQQAEKEKKRPSLVIPGRDGRTASAASMYNAHGSARGKNVRRMSMPQRRKSAIGRKGSNVPSDAQTAEQKEQELVDMGELPTQANPMASVDQTDDVANPMRSLGDGVNLDDLTAALKEDTGANQGNHMDDTLTESTGVPFGTGDDADLRSLAPSAAREAQRQGSQRSQLSGTESSVYSAATTVTEQSMRSSVVTSSTEPEYGDMATELRTDAFGRMSFAETTAHYVKVHADEEATGIPHYQQAVPRHPRGTVVFTDDRSILELAARAVSESQRHPLLRSPLIEACSVNPLAGARARTWGDEVPLVVTGKAYAARAVLIVVIM